MNKTENNVIEKNNTGIKVMLFIILVGLFVGMGFYIGQGSVDTPNIVNVENVFADVNGDGLPDLIVKGSVILNTEQTNF
jgi:hypothetical protein